MGEQSRKKAKSVKNAGNASKAVAKKANKEADKEKKKEIARKKKELEEELDELKGNTVQGKAVCAFVFLLLLGLSMSLFAGMVKLDVGGFAGNVLAPLIGDVPVVRSILPAEMQRKSPSELAAEQAQAEASAAAQAADAQAQSDGAAQPADAQAQTNAAKALQDYVDTYSAMNPQDAAQLFESMIPAQEDVVISILENLTPEGRAAILSNMSTANAADLTIQMQRKMEAKTQY